MTDKQGRVVLAAIGGMFRMMVNSATLEHDGEAVVDIEGLTRNLVALAHGVPDAYKRAGVTEEDITDAADIMNALSEIVADDNMRASWQ